MYSDAVDDEKLRLLAFEDRWHFVAVLCLKASGVLDAGDAADIRDRKIAVKLGLQVRDLDEVRRRLVDVGLIGDDWQPLAWGRRQYEHDSSTVRTRRYRERKAKVSPERHGDVTVTSPDTDTDTDTEKKNPPTPQGGKSRVDDTFAEIAKAAVEYLNGRCNRDFRASETSLKHPTARLKAGMSLDDLKRIVDFKAGQWLGDPERQEYLRPETLFGTKADGYLQAAKAANDPSQRTHNGRRKGRAEEAADDYFAKYGRGATGGATVLADDTDRPEGFGGGVVARAGQANSEPDPARHKNAVPDDRRLPSYARTLSKTVPGVPRRAPQ